MKKKIISLLTFAIMLAVSLTAGLIGVSGNDTTADAATSIDYVNSVFYVQNSIVIIKPDVAIIDSLKGESLAGLVERNGEFLVSSVTEGEGENEITILAIWIDRVSHNTTLVKYTDDVEIYNLPVASDRSKGTYWYPTEPLAIYDLPAEGVTVKFGNCKDGKMFSWCGLNIGGNLFNITCRYSDEEGAILEQPFTEKYTTLAPIAIGDNLRGKTILADMENIRTSNKLFLDFENNAADIIDISQSAADQLKGIFAGEETEMALMLTGFVMPDDKDYIVKTCVNVGYSVTKTVNSEYLTPLIGDYSVFDVPASTKTSSEYDKYKELFPEGISDVKAAYPCVFEMPGSKLSINTIARLAGEDNYFEYFSIVNVSSDIVYSVANNETGFLAVFGLNENFLYYASSSTYNSATSTSYYYGYLVSMVDTISVYGCDNPNLENVVTYDNQGEVTKNRYMKSVEKATAPATVPEKDGYNFIGWETADGEIYDFNAPLAGNVELTAAFERAAVDVTFELETPVVVTTDIGQAVVAPTVPDKTGYTFNGWFTDEALTTVFDLETPIADAMTLYPKYTVNSYTVTYKMATDVVVNQQYGQAFASVPDTSKTGYTFNGWFTDEALTVAFDKDGTVPATNLTVYPKYSINKYTVTFADGSDNPATVEVNYGELVAIPEAPAKDGYIFNCWLNADGKAFDFEKTAITEDIELTADFEATWQTKAVDWLTPNHKWAAPTAVAVILIIAFGIAIGVKRKR